MGLRKIAALTLALPPSAAINQGLPGGWEQNTEFLATRLEQADAHTRALLDALNQKPHGRPLRIDRPGTRRLSGGWGAVKKFVKGGE